MLDLSACFRYNNGRGIERSGNEPPQTPHPLREELKVLSSHPLKTKYC